MVNSPGYNSVYSRHYCQVINKHKTACMSEEKLGKSKLQSKITAQEH